MSGNLRIATNLFDSGTSQSQVSYFTAISSQKTILSQDSLSSQLSQYEDASQNIFALEKNNGELDVCCAVYVKENIPKSHNDIIALSKDPQDVTDVLEKGEECHRLIDQQNLTEEAVNSQSSDDPLPRHAPHQESSHFSTCEYHEAARIVEFANVVSGDEADCEHHHDAPVSRTSPDIDISCHLSADSARSLSSSSSSSIHRCPPASPAAVVGLERLSPEDSCEQPDLDPAPLIVPLQSGSLPNYDQHLPSYVGSLNLLNGTFNSVQSVVECSSMNDISSAGRHGVDRAAPAGEDRLEERFPDIHVQTPGTDIDPFLGHDYEIPPYHMLDSTGKYVSVATSPVLSLNLHETWPTQSSIRTPISCGNTVGTLSSLNQGSVACYPALCKVTVGTSPISHETRIRRSPILGQVTIGTSPVLGQSTKAISPFQQQIVTRTSSIPPDGCVNISKDACLVESSECVPDSCTDHVSRVSPHQHSNLKQVAVESCFHCGKVLAPDRARIFESIGVQCSPEQLVTSSAAAESCCTACPTTICNASEDSHDEVIKSFRHDQDVPCCAEPADNGAQRERQAHCVNEQGVAETPSLPQDQRQPSTTATSRLERVRKCSVVDSSPVIVRCGLPSVNLMARSAVAASTDVTILDCTSSNNNLATQVHRSGVVTSPQQLRHQYFSPHFQQKKRQVSSPVRVGSENRCIRRNKQRWLDKSRNSNKCLLRRVPSVECDRHLAHSSSPDSKNGSRTVGTVATDTRHSQSSDSTRITRKVGPISRAKSLSYGPRSGRKKPLCTNDVIIEPNADWSNRVLSWLNKSFPADNIVAASSRNHVTTNSAGLVYSYSVAEVTAGRPLYKPLARKARRPRQNFLQSEIENLTAGVSKYGWDFKAIRLAYEFLPGRTSVDLYDKYRHMVRR